MNMPALRFKDDDVLKSWKEDNLLNLSVDGFTNGVFNDPNKAGSGYKLINVLDMYIDSTINEKRLSLVGLSDAEFKRNKVEHGEIFFTRSSLVKEGIAKSNVYLGHSQDITFDGHLIRMCPKKEVLNSVFTNYLLRTSKVRKQLVARGKTATMTTIGQADIAAVMITFPSLREQTKIAKFLSAVDEKISFLTQKHDLLTQYKKGVMQQIFSQELRFKDDDGQDFPEWEEAGFDELFYVANNKKIQIKSSDYLEQGNTPIVDQGQKHIVGYTNNTEIYKDVPVIIFGDHTRILKWIDFVFASGADGTQLLKSTDKLNLKFGYYALCHIELPNLGYSRHMKELKNQFIIIPTSIVEQTKIANFLTAIDDKITATQAQLKAVKQYKQGLLQQMFV
jgi:type I restriction enzyme S subunit